MNKHLRVGKQIQAKVWIHTRNQIRVQPWRLVDEQIFYNTHNQIINQVWGRIWGQLIKEIHNV